MPSRSQRVSLGKGLSQRISEFSPSVNLPFVKAKPVFTLGIERFRVLIFRGNIKPSCHNLFDV